jgi:predicted DNA-binding transcriptional regulator AlpA
MVSRGFVGPSQIAELLGLTRQRVHQIAGLDPTFPKPAADLGAGRRVWRRADVEKWARKTGRL